MSPQDLLKLTQQLLAEVLRFDHPTDAVVSRFFREHRSIGMRERATLAETTYAVVRRKPLLQHLAQSGNGPLERRLAILGWQGNSGWLQHALSPQELAWLTHVNTIDLTTLPEALRHNLPQWLSTRIKEQMEEVAFWQFIDSIDQSAPLDLRVNALKYKRDEARRLLREAGIIAEPTPYSPWGLRVQGKPALNKVPLFLDGGVEVQDEGSQLLALLTGARRGEMVIDFCAGAGGKTLALGAMMRNTGRLYAWDVSAHRLDALKPRLARSGLSNVHPAALSNERDPRVKRLHGKANRVLIDAPCSGLGTLRRNPDLKWRQSPQSVEELTHKQAAILEAASKLLKPGGTLVYATCSLLPQENEQMAAQFSQAHTEFEPLSVAQALETQGVKGAQTLVQAGEGCDYLRLWPYVHATDGFFAALWQRKA